MLNQVILVGRVTKDLELEETKTGRKVCNFTLAIPRNFKNAEGNYDTDFINVTTWENIAKNMVKSVRKGDMVGVRGKLQSEIKEVGEIKFNSVIVLGERVTILTSGAKDDR